MLEILSEKKWGIKSNLNELTVIQSCALPLLTILTGYQLTVKGKSGICKLFDNNFLLIQ